MSLHLVSLSKTISHALRHAPWLYELELDDEGWTDLQTLLHRLRQERVVWKQLTTDDVRHLIETSGKRRFEIQDDKIRAIYGHSIAGKLSRQPAEPPEVLFHGTSPQAVASIRESGLKPMRRQYVHLSSDQATAKQVGQRKAAVPVLLQVRARQAFQAGIGFYFGHDLVWLSDDLPPEFLDFPEDD